MSEELVFLCGARDFHAMDWYKSAKELLSSRKIIILTDLIAGEGFRKIVSDNDNVERLLILDKALFRKQSRKGDIWRNILKLLVFPIQVALIKRFAKKHPGAVYHAHSMYYLFLGYAAGVTYVGTPQGSDVLIKPYKSKLFRYMAVKAMTSAKAITVDSVNMKNKVFELTGKTAHIIQNGIDIDSIYRKGNLQNNVNKVKENLLSIRGFAPLYRIKEIITARNNSDKYNSLPIKFIYPFYENEYLMESNELMIHDDRNIGRVDRDSMYDLLRTSKLVFSIPISDSSPRSVYEAIFCGCAVVISHNAYYDILPSCMQARIILADLESPAWIDNAIEKAEQIIQTKYEPSVEAMDKFDQKRSFARVEKLLFDKI